MDEFFSNLLLFDTSSEVDSITRRILLHQAYFESDRELKLGFEKEFLRFLATSEFLDNFFSELNGELVKFEDIETGDTYAEYEEHLRILEKISDRYNTLLFENNLYDRKYSQYSSINELYLALFDSITVCIEGYPTNRELEIFAKIATSKNIILYINKNRFTSKLVQKLQRIGIDLTGMIDGEYKIDLGTKTVELIRAGADNKNIEVTYFSERIYQAGFVFYMIERFIDSNIAPEDICVVLPDESFAPILKSVDYYNNLNFAMGESIRRSLFFNKLLAIRDFVCSSDEEAKQKLVYYDCLEFALGYESVDKLLKEILPDNDKEISGKLREKIKELSVRLDTAMEFYSKDSKTALWLFVDALQSETIDDATGGKVTVMGTLETRGISKKAAIIVDFNEQKVPQVSDKDLFLNTKIRAKCGLPTSSEREDLQSYYYGRIAESFDRCVVCYVKNERENPSSLLRFFNTKEVVFGDNEALFVLKKLLSKNRPTVVHTKKDKEIYKVKTLSATSLKDFLECKRRYYLKYIKRLCEHTNESDLKSSEMGTLFHFVAAKVINEQNLKASKIALADSFRKEFSLKIEDSSLPEYEFETYMLLSKLEQFFEYESERLIEYSPVFTEKEFVFSELGVELRGKMDRVDIDKTGKYSIIDYKLKNSVVVDSVKKIESKPEDIVDFQLAIYTLALINILKIDEAEFFERHFEKVCFYDVYNAKIVPEESVQMKIALLRENLSFIGKLDLTVDDFTLCDKKSNCRFCAYKDICGR